MFPEIKAIFMDVGDTLWFVVNDEALQAGARQQLMATVGTLETEGAFFNKLDTRWKECRKWPIENTSELLDLFPPRK